MRISEEVDALEVMAVPSLPFLVTTRIIAGLIAIVPLYVVGLLSSYFASRLVVTQFFGQSAGTYDDYFNQFLPPGDVLWSFGKVLVFAIMVILIHCYHGYTASGGPAGWAWPSATPCARASWRSTWSTCCCRWRSGAPPPPSDWRGSG